MSHTQPKTKHNRGLRVLMCAFLCLALFSVAACNGVNTEGSAAGAASAAGETDPSAETAEAGATEAEAVDPAEAANAQQYEAAKALADSGDCEAAILSLREISDYPDAATLLHELYVTQYGETVTAYIETLQVGDTVTFGRECDYVLPEVTEEEVATEEATEEAVATESDGEATSEETATEEATTGESDGNTVTEEAVAEESDGEATSEEPVTGDAAVEEATAGSDPVTEEAATEESAPETAAETAAEDPTAEEPVAEDAAEPGEEEILPEGTPIEWIVLDRQGDNVLLMAKAALTCRLYNERYFDMTWEECSLRGWLNEDFLLTAFSEEEAALILETETEAQGIEGTPVTDKVFLLSAGEVTAYVAGTDYAVCMPTEAALSAGAYTDDRGACLYYTRSVGYQDYYVSAVCPDGSVAYGGVGIISPGCCVRPAMWISLTDLTEDAPVAKAEPAPDAEPVTADANTTFTLGDVTVNATDTELILSTACDATYSDIAAAMAGMPHLTYADLTGCVLTDLEKDLLLSTFQSVEIIYLIHFDVYDVRTDAQALSTGQRHDVLDGVHITGERRYGNITDEDVAQLRYCVGLIALDIGHCTKITDVSPLSSLTNMQYLIIAMMQITDIRCVEHMENLRFFECFETNVSDMSPALNCKNLRFFNCGWCKIEDWTPLMQMTWLEMLWCSPKEKIREGYYWRNNFLPILEEALPNTRVYYYPAADPCDNWRKTNEGYAEMQKLFKLSLALKRG